MKNGPYNLIVAPKDYPGKRYRGRYAYEHIVNYWMATGIVPPGGHEIHHVNGDHRDNEIDNLRLVTTREHRRLHGQIILRKSRITVQCAFCGKDKELLGRDYRFKIKRGYNTYCSTKCQHQGLIKK